MSRTRRTYPRGGIGASRVALRRQHQVIRMVRTRQVSAGQMARELQVTRKTVQRHINYLRDTYGLDLEFDRHQGSWICHTPIRAIEEF